MIAATSAIAVGIARGPGGQAPARYITGVVTRGELKETIRATGTVQPVSQVSVGAQVSGRVTRVLVNYNSRVKVGDLLGEIDAIPYRAQITQAQALLMSARAQLAQNRANAVLAQQTLARQGILRGQGINAPAELDSAVASAAVAHAAVAVASAAVDQAEAAAAIAQANLAYTRIRAPINGTVAARSVEPGQTVAATFQTPTLFVIANDLSHMQILANVDEAHVGKLAEGMDATARIDAFPQDIFEGEVSQLRISPTTTNGVVTYQAVIAIANPGSRLRPGMTATTTVITARRDGVFRVPNSALRYRPGPSTPPAAPDESPDDAPDDGPARGFVFVEGARRAARIAVQIGITDGSQTEITGPDVSEGMRVIVDETDTETRPRPPAGPRMF